MNILASIFDDIYLAKRAATGKENPLIGGRFTVAMPGSQYESQMKAEDAAANAEQEQARQEEMQKQIEQATGGVQEQMGREVESARAENEQLRSQLQEAAKAVETESQARRQAEQAADSAAREAEIQRQRAEMESHTRDMMEQVKNREAEANEAIRRSEAQAAEAARQREAQYEKARKDSLAAAGSGMPALMGHGMNRLQKKIDRLRQTTGAVKLAAFNGIVKEAVGMTLPAGGMGGAMITPPYNQVVPVVPPVDPQGLPKRPPGPAGPGIPAQVGDWWKNKAVGMAGFGQKMWNAAGSALPVAAGAARNGWNTLSNTASSASARINDGMVNLSNQVSNLATNPEAWVTPQNREHWKSVNAEAQNKNDYYDHPEMNRPEGTLPGIEYDLGKRWHDFTGNLNRQRLNLWKAPGRIMYEGRSAVSDLLADMNKNKKSLWDYDYQSGEAQNIWNHRTDNMLAAARGAAMAVPHAAWPVAMAPFDAVTSLPHVGWAARMLGYDSLRGAQEKAMNWLSPKDYSVGDQTGDFNPDGATAEEFNKMVGNYGRQQDGGQAAGQAAASPGFSSGRAEYLWNKAMEYGQPVPVRQDDGSYQQVPVSYNAIPGYRTPNPFVESIMNMMPPSPPPLYQLVGGSPAGQASPQFNPYGGMLENMMPGMTPEMTQYVQQMLNERLQASVGR